MSVKLVLRDKEYEVKPGMALREALLKHDLLPEATLAIRRGEMLTEEEILVDGDVVKLVAVISGGAS
jgi:sulfur carrier protein ThiS